MKILVCEDDILTLKTIEYSLIKNGFQVITAIDGAEGAEILRQNLNEIGFLITDQHMPYFTGMELINLVRNELKLTFPIFMLTKINVDEIKARAFELGADEYITKPFNPEILTQKVKYFLLQRTRK